MSRSAMNKRSGLIQVLQRALDGIDNAWWWGEGLMREVGLLPQPPAPLDPLEDVVQETLRPVEPSEAFRRSLRNDLDFAAHHRHAGLIVERPRPFREGLILGIVLGLIAILGTTLLIALWPRQRVGSGHP